MCNLPQGTALARGVDCMTSEEPFQPPVLLGGWNSNFEDVHPPSELTEKNLNQILLESE